MRISSAGLEIIKRNEGCRLTAYRDVVGVLTIGWGHTGPDVREGMTITKEDAEQRLTDRLAREFEPGVLAVVRNVPITQNQFDAMVSLAYNIGVGAFAKSSVTRYHRGGEHAKAADAFLLYNKGGRPLRVIAGLVRRRTEERALYLSGTHAAAPAPNTFSHTVAESVMRLQIALNAAGASLSIDGELGPRTLAAYRAAVARI